MVRIEKVGQRTLYTSYCFIIESNKVYNLFKKSTTCIGVDCPERVVNPTISEKYIVTDAKVSGTTSFPSNNCWATDLKIKKLADMAFI